MKTSIISLMVIAMMTIGTTNTFAQRMNGRSNGPRTEMRDNGGRNNRRGMVAVDRRGDRGPVMEARHNRPMGPGPVVVREPAPRPVVVVEPAPIPEPVPPMPAPRPRHHANVAGVVAGAVIGSVIGALID